MNEAELNMSIVFWKIGNAEGSGKPMPTALARDWVKEMNLKYGAGTHWLKEQS